MISRERYARVLSRTTGVAALALGVCLATPAFATGTSAGTSIANTATATYQTPGGDVSVNSNTVTLKVDELLNVAVAWGDPADVVGVGGSTGQVLKFTVTNGGNGSEPFRLATVANSGGDDFDPSVTSIVLDANGNGAYDAGVDTLYSAGSNDPVLAADQSLAVFVVSSLPGGLADGARGRVDLTATSVTGSGAPGTTFAGRGDSGVDAVVGATRATAQDDGFYKIAAATATLTKTASVVDPFGGSTGAPGAVITYQLALQVTGSGSLANVRVNDTIPAGTTYQAGTLKLDGAALSDAADADAGQFTGSAIAVTLGSVAAGASHSVSFKTKIN